jgi:hypothetical protein
MTERMQIGETEDRPVLEYEEFTIRRGPSPSKIVQDSKTDDFFALVPEPNTVRKVCIETLRKHIQRISDKQQSFSTSLPAQTLLYGLGAITKRA